MSRRCWQLVIATLASAHASYDDAAELIVSHAQAAAAAHNRGDSAGSAAAAKLAVSAYDAAVKLSPKEPQAHLHVGQFFYNTHRFDEAIAAWELALPLVAGITSQAPTGGTWTSYISGRVTAARIGKHAVARDAAYGDGQGDMRAALEHSLAQVAIAPDAPHFRFDAATIRAVMGEDGNASAILFEEAQRAAADAAGAFLRRDRARTAPPGGGDGCPRRVDRKPVVGAPPFESYRGFTAMSSPTVTRIAGPASLHGPEGVAVSSGAAGDDGCAAVTIHGGAAWPFQPLHASLWLSEEAWRVDGQASTPLPISTEPISTDLNPSTDPPLPCPASKPRSLI